MNQRLTVAYGDYVRVLRKCPYRKGWIIELQLTNSEWTHKKYDKYR